MIGFTNPFKRDKRTEVEVILDDQLAELMDIAETPREIDELVGIMERRQKLKDSKKRVSPDTLAVIIGNLVGIGLILNYEKLDTIRSQAMKFVLRGKV